VNISSNAVVMPPVGNASAVIPATRTFLGSGFIIDPSRIILINNHVVANPFRITTTLQDNTELTAEPLAASTLADLALLRVHSARQLPALSFGDAARSSASLATVDLLPSQTSKNFRRQRAQHATSMMGPGSVRGGS
jgi:S1-C subfamily serine protease